MTAIPRQLPQSVLVPYTGGYTVNYGGYLYELCPFHPKANPFGFVPQHRLVLERHLGRFLKSDEQVHHIDENPLNNDIENLVVLSRSAHFRLHRQKEFESRHNPLTADLVKKALANGGLKAAARSLGCHTETIRNNYPELVAPYKRKSPAKLDDPAWVEKLRALAADENVGYREAAALLGISAESIGHILKRNSIEWVRKSKVGEIHSKYTFRNRKPNPTK